MELIRKGDIKGFGQFLFESHQSSIENFENSCPELDIVVEAAQAGGALGARLSGGAGRRLCYRNGSEGSGAGCVRKNIRHLPRKRNHSGVPHRHTIRRRRDYLSRWRNFRRHNRRRFRVTVTVLEQFFRRFTGFQNLHNLFAIECFILDQQFSDQFKPVTVIF